MHRTFVPGPLLLRSGADARPLAGEYGFHWNLCCHWLKGLLRRPVAVIRQDPGIHYNDVMMSTMASQMTSLVIVYSTVYSRSRSKKISKLRVTDLCAGNSPVTGEFPAQTASNAEVFPFDDVIMTCASLHIHTCTTSLRWRHNDHDSVSNHQPHGCLLSRLFGRTSKKHQSSASLAFVRRIHRDRWIPRTKGQLRGKCFHLMTSSCYALVIGHISIYIYISVMGHDFICCC